MTLPIVEPPAQARPDEDEVGKYDRTGPVAGVLLAAGASSRFGPRNKLLETVDGDPMVRLAASTLLESRVDDVVAVVGYECDRVRDALDDLELSIGENPEYREGQATSVRTGLEAVTNRADAAVFSLGDMPFVGPASVDALIDAYRANLGDALATAYDGTRGNPVLFDRTHFDALTAVEGDVGGRRILLEGANSALVAVDDPGVLRDVDTPSDLSSANDRSG